MRQEQVAIQVGGSGAGLCEITAEVEGVVAASGITTGVCSLFLQHTSASLVIQENADPSARHDLEAFLRRVAPEGDPAYTHTAEGADDMPAHLRAALTSTSEQIPVAGGRLALGTWQGIFLCEHRRHASRRRLIVHLIGE